ncbi:ROK family protein [Staphylococcus arlettae]|nr:ROK family protein [Staphylococcus arlettae]
MEICRLCFSLFKNFRNTTDVNGSAYGEYITYKSRNQSIDSLVYLTVGTGIGGGCVINGNIMKNFSHPEMGHMLIKVLLQSKKI